RAEDRERDERKENRVEAGDDRRLGDPRVAEDLRDVHRRQRQPGESVAQRLARLDRQQAAKKRKAHPLGALLRRHVHGRTRASRQGTGEPDRNFRWGPASIPHDGVLSQFCHLGRLPFCHPQPTIARTCRTGDVVKHQAHRMDYRKEFRVEPDAKIKLKKIDPAYTGKGALPDEAKEEIEIYLKKLFKQQALLYAEHKHSILVVLQALDAGGKDGTIKHVFTALNPQGASVASFKQPTPTELAHDF